MTNQAVSNDRVNNYGEVFTPPHIVTEMHDLIPAEEWARKDFIYLEPTCGKGVFLIDAIKRKVKAGLTITESVNSVFGMDIQEDNIKDTHDIIMGFVRECTHDKKVIEKCSKIVRHNIFQVTDSLIWIDRNVKNYPKTVQPEWLDLVYPNQSLIEMMPFLFEDPTGNENIIDS